MAVSQIRTDCFIEINAYTYIMFGLHKFDSQLQCTIELDNLEMETKYIKSKQTLHDMHDHETYVKVVLNLSERKVVHRLLTIYVPTITELCP